MHAYIPSSLRHGVQQAELAHFNALASNLSELQFEAKALNAYAHHVLRSSGCSIVVVYSVWDRVVRVRFPAPRQIVQWTVC